MIKLSNYDGRFVVQLLELRRAAILEMTQRLPEQLCKEQVTELERLDAVLTEIKAELPQYSHRVGACLRFPQADRQGP
jgi:hypothetical protein